jgi:signal transduction histidine kinase
VDENTVSFLCQHCGVTVVFVNRQGLVVWTRGDTSGFFGTITEVAGRPLLELVPELVGDEETVARILAGALSALEIPWINRYDSPGDPLYFNLALVPWRDGQGQIMGLMQVTEDVSDAGRMQQELVQHRNELALLQAEMERRNLELAAANAELERLGEVKSEFLSIAAHELRTPLATILGYLELLLDGAYGSMEPQQEERVGLVHASAERLNRIVNDLLDATRLELGHLELLLQPVDLQRIVTRVIAENEPQLAAREQRVDYQARCGLPPVMCDPTRMAQIVTNLLTNASKYSPPRSVITIAATLAAEEGFVQLSVADQGMGIASSDQERIFGRFQRGQNVERWGMPGTGLGLFISRALAELQGGHIWLESTLGRGSTFRVTLPIAGA